MVEKLDDTNFVLYAARHYNNPECCETLEFYDDLKKFKYLKRLFNKYSDTGDLKVRLIINHIIVIYNLFGTEAATRMLFFKLFPHTNELATFLQFLNYMPKVINNITHLNITIDGDDVKYDEFILKQLETI